MLRRLLCLSVTALVLAPVASADGGGPSPGVDQGWDGVTNSRLPVRYVTATTGTNTVLEVIRKRDGRVLNFMSLTGLWGIPAVTYNGQAGGLSIDGRTLVLQEATTPHGPLRSQTSFLVIDTKRWRPSQPIILQGDFSFDALSPQARTLYLIHHVSATNVTHYVVRAYDLANARLLPGRIADRTQRGWVMRGFPVARATSGDGRWVYTLYRNDGGYPFVHALETVKGKAHCIGLPWQGSQDNLNLRLSLRDSGRRLVIGWQDGASSPFGSIDTRTYRFVRAAYGTGGGGGASFPWWAILVAVAVPVGALVARILLRRSKTAEVQPT
jgi:hypothetical protein